MEGAPDSSQVVDNPDYEFDEFVEERTPLATTPPVGELSREECEHIRQHLHQNLQGEGLLSLAFENAITSLLSGPAARAALKESQSAQLQQARELVGLAKAPGAVSVAMEESMRAHAKKTFAHLVELQASKQIEELSALFASLGAGEAACPPGTSEELEQAVEQGAPLLLFALGDKDFAAQWQGQLLLQFNPLAKRLELGIFRFQPRSDASDEQLFDSQPQSKAAMKRLLQLQARFAVSRLFRMSLLLHTITALGLVGHPHHTELAALRLRVSQPPLFASRRISSNHVAHNTWRPLRDPTAGAAVACSDFVFVGHRDTLQYLVAMLVESSSELPAMLQSPWTTPTAGSPSAPTHATPASASSTAAATSSGGAAARVLLRARGMESVDVEYSDSEDETLAL